MKINIQKVFYILSIVIMCGFKFVSVPYIIKYMIGLLWIVYALSQKTNEVTKEGMSITKIFYRPYIIIFLISPLLMLISPLEDIDFVESITRMLSLLTQSTIAIFFGYASFRVFGVSAVNNMFCGLIANNFLGILWAIYKFGVEQFIEFITNPFADIWNTYVFGGRISNALELHEVTFTLGLYFVFFAFYREYNKYIVKKDIYKLITTIILLYLGYKRIQILALFATFILSILITRINDKKSFSYANNIVWLGTLCVMLLYLFIISTDVLAILGEKYNINFMSRLEWFDSLRNYYTFEVFYIGKGFGALSRVVDFLNQGVHNDILRNYIEFGFWGFILWMTYMLKFIPHKIGRKYLSVAKLYLYLITYTMVTYMTDNTFNYMLFQASIIIIIMVAIQKNKLKAPQF